jgi:uncharacterized protein (TIGR02145 family)
MSSNESNATSLTQNKKDGYSIRCLQGEGILLPAVATNAATNITYSTATSGGNVTSDGGASVTARGACWSTSQNPTVADNHTDDGIGTGSFTSSLTGLSSNTTYYVRAYATNSSGTAYGSQVNFTTDPATITDADGNVYNVIRIGTQLWIKENLKTTKFNDNSTIPSVTLNSAWASLITPGRTWYANNGYYGDIYGGLYNWYAVNTGILCPIGWHVPSSDEEATLINYLGGGSIAGGKLKETGTTHWTGPNTGATNETGFTALPGGYRSNDGTFVNIEGHGYWWSSNYPVGYGWAMHYNSSSVVSDVFGSTYGLSIRCLRD